MLVAAIVGLDTRATMDIDTTVKALELTKDNAIKIVDEIIAVEIPDGVQFRIAKVTDIMEGHDYPGIRFVLDATLDRMRQAIETIAHISFILLGRHDDKLSAEMTNDYLKLMLYNVSG